MRFIPIVLSIFLLPEAFAQQQEFIDSRDGKKYGYVEINGLSWMTDNLEYEAENTLNFNDSLVNYNTTGLYYHVTEFNKVCPNGWRIPNVEDWMSYFKYLAELDGEVDLSITNIDKPVHYTVANYNKKIDMFDKNSPMKLRPTGRIEGGILNKPTSYADFWVVDPNEEVEGTSHIHMMNPWTTIHSHKHHLKPRQKKKLRMFMVRCVR